MGTWNRWPGARARGAGGEAPGSATYPAKTVRAWPRGRRKASSWPAWRTWTPFCAGRRVRKVVNQMVGTIANVLVVAWLVGMAARIYTRISVAGSQRRAAQMQRLMLQRAKEGTSSQPRRKED